MFDGQVPEPLLIFVPAIMVVVQQLKKTRLYPHIKNWIGLISMAAGVGIALLVMSNATIPERVVAGILLGVAPVGTFETAKAIIKKI